MALDKQKILNELESVVNQLQSANCGCLSNVFNSQQVLNSQQNMMGYSAPHSCGINCHGGACGHTPNAVPLVQNSCKEPCTNIQPNGNCIHHQRQANLGNTARNHFDPALVQPIVNDVYEELKSMTPENTVVNSPIANQMGLPLAKDPHNMRNPCNAINMQKAMENAKAMQAMGNNYMNVVNSSDNPVNNELVNAQTNSPMLVPPAAMTNVMQCHNCKTSVPVQQMTNNLGHVPNMIPANPQQMSHHQSPYGQHAQGMAKFQELFPGIMGNGDLGFDPMAVAINMNPSNQQNAQVPVAPNIFNANQASNALTCAHRAAPPQQKLNQLLNGNAQIHPVPSMGVTISDLPKVQHQSSNNGLYPNEQQAYQMSPRQHIMTQDKVAANVDPVHRPFHPATEKLVNEVLPGSLTTPKPVICDHAHTSVGAVSKIQQQGRTIEYNTLGQPVEILPAEIYHKPEEALPQTLSPQPNSINNFLTSHNKASTSRENIVNNTALNKNHCLMSNHMSYGTHSDGQLNVNLNQNNNNNNFVEKMVGDTSVNYNMSPRPRADFPSGDKPDTMRHVTDSSEKLSPNSYRKHRNGLQDIVYTSYPTSTKWSFHGNARKSLPPAQRPT